MCNVAKHSLCGFVLRFWGFLPKCGSSCVLGREWAPTRGTWKKTKSRLVTVQERRHHPYSVEWTLTLSGVTQGHRAASAASGSTFHTALEALFCWHRHSPSLSGNKGCFLQLYTLLHTFTFMLWFIDLLVMGGIRVGCTCSSALLIFFIIALDTNSALGLGRGWFMWHILSSENGVYKVFFLLSSPVVASVKLSLYLRAAAVEYCCCVTHPGRWFVTGEDRGRRKNCYRCGPGSFVHAALWLQRMCGTGQHGQLALLTADHWQTWVDQPGLPEYFISILAAANVTAGCLLPTSSVKAEDIGSCLEKEDREWCFSRRHVVVGDKTD